LWHWFKKKKKKDQARGGWKCCDRGPAVMK
jgi:hypothetical protein